MRDDHLVTATMATTPERLPHAIGVAHDLRRQVDRLYIRVNGAAPVAFKIPEGAEMTFDTTRDLADNAKFVDVPECGWHFTVDDDLHYPPDYVSRTIAGAERYNRKAVVSWHGATVRNGAKSYYKDRMKYPCLGTVAEDAACNVPGTGVMAYHTDTIRVSLADFDVPYMADLWMGFACQRHRVPVVVLAHRQGWLRHRDIDHSTTIWARFNKNDSVQTALVNRIDWTLHQVNQ